MKIAKFLLLLMVLYFTATAYAATVTDNEHGVLKLDRKNTDLLPDNFRTSGYAFEYFRQQSFFGTGICRNY